MNARVREAIDRYFARIPGAREAHTSDPVYRAQFTYMRRVLEMAEMAMEDEGIDEPTRARVIRTVVFGAPDEYASMERLRVNEQVVRDAMKSATPLGFRPDLFRQPGADR